MAINNILFSRVSPEKRLAFIETMTPSDLKAITPETVKRIIKAIGKRYVGSRDWTLNIPNQYMVGNNWNSWVTRLGIMNGKLYVMVYLQYGSTDTEIPESYDKFFAKGDYRGSYQWNDRYGNPQTCYFTYSESDKMRCLRWLLVLYLKIRYKDKFDKSEAA